MKQFIRYSPWLIVVVLLGFIFFRPAQVDKSQVDQAKAEKRAAKKELAQMQVDLEFTRDTLKAVLSHKTSVEQDNKILLARSLKSTIIHEKITFKPTTRDPERDSIWARLYPTLKSLR